MFGTFGFAQQRHLAVGKLPKEGRGFLAVATVFAKRQEEAESKEEHL